MKMTLVSVQNLFPYSQFLVNCAGISNEKNREIINGH